MSIFLFTNYLNFDLNYTKTPSKYMIIFLYFNQIIKHYRKNVNHLYAKQPFSLEPKIPPIPYLSMYAYGCYM
jgi:hypothetical protein